MLISYQAAFLYIARFSHHHQTWQWCSRQNRSVSLKCCLQIGMSVVCKTRQTGVPIKLDKSWSLYECFLFQNLSRLQFILITSYFKNLTLCSTLNSCSTLTHVQQALFKFNTYFNNQFNTWNLRLMKPFFRYTSLGIQYFWATFLTEKLPQLYHNEKNSLHIQFIWYCYYQPAYTACPAIIVLLLLSY